MTGSGRMSRFGLLVVVVLCCVVFAAVAVLLPERAVRVATAVLLLYVLFTRLIFTGDHQLALWHLVECELQSRVSIVLFGSHLYHRTGPGRNDRHWREILAVVVHLRHSQFSANQGPHKANSFK